MTSAETVLITGASAGIGVELARLFAADRSNLILVARRVERLETLAAELRQQHGVSVQVLAADLSAPDAAEQVFNTLNAQGAIVDVLVNNAGFGAHGFFFNLDADLQTRMIQVNVVATTQLTRLFLPGMIERRRGGVLNVASIAGFQPGPWMTVYYATKAYFLSFSEALAEEVRGKGVTITCLAPGPTVTEFGQVAGAGHTPLFRIALMEGAEVARAGHRGYRKGKILVIPGLLNRLVPFVVRLLPRSWVRKMAGSLQRAR